MKQSNKSFGINNAYACSTAGGGVMYIPEAIERTNKNVSNSELNMSTAVPYKTLVGDAITDKQIINQTITETRVAAQKSI